MNTLVITNSLVNANLIAEATKLLRLSSRRPSDRAGRDRAWRIDAQQLALMRTYLERISAQWDARLARLKALVEDDG